MAVRAPACDVPAIGTAERSAPLLADSARLLRRAYWCLRVGASACFIGHGAFGVITKAAWVPYFAFAGLPAEWAYKLMPVVGTVDILVGISVLLSPRPIVLLYMTIWALWTALLRPLVGESPFEAMERAGNSGVPLALIFLLGRPRTLRNWFRTSLVDPDREDRAGLVRVLTWTACLLLFGHGALAAITGKAVFAAHYATLGLPPTLAPLIGWAEMVVALLVVIRPGPGILIGVVVWKMATEALYPLSGAPIWEFVERAGSYAAPLALALLLIRANRARATLGRSIK
ncbi:MAG: hypothetical protein ABI647_01460 [Gemmatimonadota bacterium]